MIPIKLLTNERTNVKKKNFKAVPGIYFCRYNCFDDYYFSPYSLKVIFYSFKYVVSTLPFLVVQSVATQEEEMRKVVGKNLLPFSQIESIDLFFSITHKHKRQQRKTKKNVIGVKNLTSYQIIEKIRKVFLLLTHYDFIFFIC